MRKLFLPVSIGLLALSTVFSSCEKEQEDTSSLGEGKEYYPLQKGKYIIYDVDSTYWDDFMRNTYVRSSQMRYEIADEFTNAEGKLSYKVDIFHRNSSSESFRPVEVMYVTPSETDLKVNQQNLTFIKLIFPVSEDRTWDGNALVPRFDQDYTAEYGNTNGWLYQYKNVGKPHDVGNNYFANTITVNQIDEQLNDPDVDTTSYAYRNYMQEIYAKNVGMIYRERIYWEFQPKSPDGQSGGSGYRKGYGVVMKATEHN